MAPAPRPRIRLYVSIGAHRTARDAQNVKQLIDEVRPHAVVCESAFCSEAVADELESKHEKDLSRARRSTDSLRRATVASAFHPSEGDTFTRTLFSHLIENNVPVLCAERHPERESSRLIELDRTDMDRSQTARQAFRSGDLHKAKMAALEAVEARTEVNHARHQNMARVLQERVTQWAARALEKVPRYLGGGEARVVLRIGRDHRDWARLLPARLHGFDVELREDGSALEPRAHEPEDIGGHEIIKQYLRHHFGRLTSDSIAADDAAHELARNLTPKAIEHLSQEMGRVNTEREKDRAFIHTFNEITRETLPVSESGLMEFLQERAAERQRMEDAARNTDSESD